MWEGVGSVALDSVPPWLSDMRSMIDPKLLQEVDRGVLTAPSPSVLRNSSYASGRPLPWGSLPSRPGAQTPKPQGTPAGRLLALTAHRGPRGCVPVSSPLRLPPTPNLRGLWDRLLAPVPHGDSADRLSTSSPLRPYHSQEPLNPLPGSLMIP